MLARSEALLYIFQYCSENLLRMKACDKIKTKDLTSLLFLVTAYRFVITIFTGSRTELFRGHLVQSGDSE